MNDVVLREIEISIDDRMLFEKHVILDISAGRYLVATGTHKIDLKGPAVKKYAMEIDFPEDLSSSPEDFAIQLTPTHFHNQLANPFSYVIIAQGFSVRSGNKLIVEIDVTLAGEGTIFSDFTYLCIAKRKKS